MHYSILLQHVSIPVGIILRDTFKSENYTIGMIRILCTVTYAKYCHSSCVIFTFKRVPEDDPNRDRNILNKYCNVRTC
jgi:hypothetical protein